MTWKLAMGGVMPGMNSGLNVTTPLVVAAFRSALLHQGLIALLIFGTLAVAWVSVREWLPVTSSAGTTASRAENAATAEPAGRKALRIGFGLLWIFDGILQAQPAMALGLPSKVIEPIAATSPPWVQRLVNWAGTTWSYHPVQAAASAVWIQIGIGIWLLVAARGAWSRLAGLVSVGWGLVVWVFAESFGGIFAPGLTWLFGAPGAVLVYAVAGALVALPEPAWQTRQLGRLVLGGLGVFLAGMAVLQAWPGRGFWQGTARGRPGTLTGMLQSMATTPQPRFLSGWVRTFASFTAAHGFAVNLVTVAVLAAIGAMFISGYPPLLRPALIAFAVLCLVDWVLIQDLGFLGGLGTDPNSMVPMILLAAGGYLALVRLPAAAEAPALVAKPHPGSLAAWREGLCPAALRRLVATASAQSVASIGAVAVIILGAAPMAVAQASPHADPILAQAIAGNSVRLDYPAPSFALTDQNGRPVTLAGLRGKAVLLTFLDDVCTTDCPLIAQEFRQVDQLLGATSRQVALVAIELNPTYLSVAYTRAFDHQEGLDHVPNWLYLTGTLAQLRQVWSAYGAVVYNLPAGAMTAHNDTAYVIDRTGRIRQELSTAPGPGTQATKSSFAVVLADVAERVLASS